VRKPPQVIAAWRPSRVAGTVAVVVFAVLAVPAVALACIFSPVRFANSPNYEYHAGDTVRVVGGQPGASNTFQPNMHYRVFLLPPETDGLGTVVADGMTSPEGVVDESFQLPANARVGEYPVTIQLDNWTATTNYAKGMEKLMVVPASKPTSSTPAGSSPAGSSPSASAPGGAGAAPRATGKRARKMASCKRTYKRAAKRAARTAGRKSARAKKKKARRAYKKCVTRAKRSAA